MANDNTTSTQFPANLSVFEGENYERWVVQMKVIFKIQYVVEIASDEVPTLKVSANGVHKVAHKEHRKKDEKLFS